MGADPNPAGPGNLGNPGEFTINQLAALVVEQTGTSSTVRHQPLPADDPMRRRPDIGRAKRLLDWTPEVPLRAGLAETIAYFSRLSQSSVETSARQERQEIAGRPSRRSRS